MKLKNVAQLERLTAKETTVTDVLESLTKAVAYQAESSRDVLEQLTKVMADQAEAIQDVLGEQSRVLKELTVVSKTQGPIAVTVEVPKERPRKWVAVIERDRRDLMSRVVITANEGA